MREGIDLKGTVPRLNQCYLCKVWRLEKNLHPIEIPDQGGSYTQRLACRGCLNEITPKPDLQDEPQTGEKKYKGKTKGVGVVFVKEDDKAIKPSERKRNQRRKSAIRLQIKEAMLNR